MKDQFHRSLTALFTAILVLITASVTKATLVIIDDNNAILFGGSFDEPLTAQSILNAQGILTDGHINRNIHIIPWQVGEEEFKTFVEINDDIPIGYQIDEEILVDPESQELPPGNLVLTDVVRGYSIIVADNVSFKINGNPNNRVVFGHFENPGNANREIDDVWRGGIVIDESYNIAWYQTGIEPYLTEGHNEVAGIDINIEYADFILGGPAKHTESVAGVNLSNVWFNSHSAVYINSNRPESNDFSVAHTQILGAFDNDNFDEHPGAPWVWSGGVDQDMNPIPTLLGLTLKGNGNPEAGFNNEQEHDIEIMENDAVDFATNFLDVRVIGWNFEPYLQFQGSVTIYGSNFRFDGLTVSFDKDLLLATDEQGNYTNHPEWPALWYQLYIAEGTQPSHNYFNNCIFAQAHFAVVRDFGMYTVFDNCQVTRWHMYWSSVNGVTQFDGHRALVESHFPRDGINQTWGVFRNCFFSRSNRQGFMHSFGTLTVTNCLFYLCGNGDLFPNARNQLNPIRCAIELGGGWDNCRNSKIENCTFVSNYTAIAIKNDGDPPMTIRNNIIYDGKYNRASWRDEYNPPDESEYLFGRFGILYESRPPVEANMPKYCCIFGARDGYYPEEFDQNNIPVRTIN